ncbi:MAG: ArnT family glycosyltransferase [Phycisphaerales bacterium]
MTTIPAPAAAQPPQAVAPAHTGGAARAFAPWAVPWRSTLLLILAATLLRLVYIAWLCPYTLIEDEAHYWEWSRRPGLSYYSKGPGLAWSVAASTALAGDTEFGVRLPAVLFAAVGALGIAALARSATGDTRAGFFAAACTLLTPAFQLGGILLTVDMPYVACWAFACLAAWHALTRASGRAWIALGLCLGIGFLFKYTILALLPGLVLFGILRRRDLRLAPRASLWITAAAALFGLCTLPVVIWNARHGWPTLHHLLGHAALPGGDMPAQNGRAIHSFEWLGEYLAAQAALIGPVLAVIAFAIARASAPAVRTRDGGEAWSGRLLLICAAAPILIGYMVLSLWTQSEGNWAVAGHAPLLALAGWGVAEAGTRRRAAPRSRRHPLWTAWRVSLVFGVVLGFGPLKLDWVDGAWAMRRVEAGLRWMGWLGEGRTLVPMGRLAGARAMAADAAELGERLREETGREPFYVAEHYGRASLLAFYLPGRPIAYCSSHQSGKGRRTQYDFWPETDLDDLGRLGERPAVLIGSTLERWSTAFERVTPVGRLPHETKKDRMTFVGFGYRGFGPPESPAGDQEDRR